MARRDHSRLEALANNGLTTEEAIEQKEELLRHGYTILDEATPFDEPEQMPRPEDQRSPTPIIEPPAKDPLHVPEELSIWLTAGETYNALIPTIRERARRIEPLEEAKAYQENELMRLVKERMPSAPDEEPLGDNISIGMMISTVYYLLAYAFKNERAQAKKMRETFGDNIESTN